MTWPADEPGKKKPSANACKLNKCLLWSLVGRAELDRRLIRVPVMERNLRCLKEHWKVSCINVQDCSCKHVMFCMADPPWYNPSLFVFGLRLKFRRVASIRMLVLSRSWSVTTPVSCFAQRLNLCNFFCVATPFALGWMGQRMKNACKVVCRMVCLSFSVWAWAGMVRGRG